MGCRAGHNLDRLILEGFVLNVDASVDQADRGVGLHWVTRVDDQLTREAAWHSARMHATGPHRGSRSDRNRLRPGIEQTDPLTGLRQRGAWWTRSRTIRGASGLGLSLDAKALRGEPVRASRDKPDARMELGACRGLGRVSTASTTIGTPACTTVVGSEACAVAGAAEVGWAWLEACYAAAVAAPWLVGAEEGPPADAGP